MTLPSIESMGAASRFVQADGLETHYVELGKGPPLILIHGGGAGADSWGNWRGCLRQYASHFHVIAYDLPGFGRSEKPDPSVYDYSQASRNRHLEALIDALHLGSVNLIGNSMGGATSLGLALSRPERVRKLVLMGSAGLNIANPNPQYMQQLQGYDYTIEAMRRTMLALAGPGYQLDEDLVQYRHAIMQQPEARRALEVIKKSKLTYEREAIARVITPTLVVGGKEDQVAVLARTYGYLELLKNSWGFIFPHCGHWVMIEAPDEFVAVTSAFLEDSLFVPPRSAAGF